MSVSAPVVSVSAPAVRPYAPSWIDRLAAALDRSPVPGRTFYIALVVVSIPIFLVADVLSGAFPLAQVLPFHVFLAALPVLTIWFTTYLDRTAERAFDQAVPVLKATSEEYVLREALGG